MAGAFFVKTTTCTCKTSGETNCPNRVEHRLATQARIITSNLRNPKYGKGQRRKIYLDKMYQLGIESSEVVSIWSLLGTKVTEVVPNVENLLQWKQKYTDLVGTIRMLHADICSNMQTKHDSNTSEPTDLLRIYSTVMTNSETLCLGALPIPNTNLQSFQSASNSEGLNN